MIFKKVVEYLVIYIGANSFVEKIVIQNWKRKNRPIPLPGGVKRMLIKEYAKKFSTYTFIETGTLYGNTVESTRHIFKKIFSIELSLIFYKKAKKRFAKFGHITIIHGDSAEILPSLLKNISEPCLFYLDAHYPSEATAKGQTETPIVRELFHIFNHSILDHVILIDDARLFNGQNGWPKIKELEEIVYKKRPNWVFEVKDDIIRIHK